MVSNLIYREMKLTLNILTLLCLEIYGMLNPRTCKWLLRTKGAPQPISEWVCRAAGGCGTGGGISLLMVGCGLYEWVWKPRFRGQEFRSRCWGSWDDTHWWSMLSRCCGYELAVAGFGGWGPAVIVVVVPVSRPRGTVVAVDLPGGCHGVWSNLITLYVYIQVQSLCSASYKI
jgi:hypothetical protein